MSRDDRRALRDANGRLLAALGRVGDRCSLGDRVTSVGHRLGEPAVRGGYDALGLLYGLVEATAVLAEAVDQELAVAEADAQPKRAR